MAHTVVNVGHQQGFAGYMEFLQNKLLEFKGQDFYRFERSQHDTLKQYIGYSLYGDSYGGVYNTSQANVINIVYNKIFENLDKFIDAVEISCVHICVVGKNLNHITEPCLIVRKCQISDHGYEPCEIVIDARSNVFHSWNNFLEDNFYRTQLIYAPANGRYRADSNGQIIVQSTKKIQNCLQVLFITDIIIFIVALVLYITGTVVRVIITSGSSSSQGLLIAIFVSAIILTIYLFIRRILLCYCLNKSGKNKKTNIKYFGDYQYSGERTRTQCKKCKGYNFVLEKRRY